MAIQEQRTLPAPFIEDIGKDFAKSLIGVTGLPALSKDISGQLTARTIQDPEDSSKFRLETPEELAQRQQIAKERFQTFEQTQAGQAGFAPSVVGQDPLQEKAAERALSGLDSFKPFLTDAQTQFGKAVTGLEGAEGLMGAGLNTAAAGEAPSAGSIAEYTSPFQQQVIDATIADFDRQRGIQEQAIKDQQAQLGVLGAARSGIQLGQFQADQDRALNSLLAGIRTQGFQDAAARRQQDIANRQGLASSRLGLGQFQTGLAQTVPGLQRADISTLGSVGAIQQAQAQAQADATREANRMAAFEPQERLGFYGQGVTGLMGGYPAQTTTTNIPNPTPLQTALGVGSTLAGIYGTVKNAGQPMFNFGKPKN
jgi:hypothetical protein